MVIEYTQDELSTVYSRFLSARGLIDFVLRSGFDLTSDPKEAEGSLMSIFQILDDYLNPAMGVLDNLDVGHTVKRKPEVIEPVGKTMTEEKYREIVKRLGGEIGNPSCCVDFPDTLRITNKKDALDLLNILMGEGKEVEHFTITQEAPFKALMTAIERGIA